jgi:hypothetical protein
LFNSQVILSNDVKNDIETHKSTNVLNNNMLKLRGTSSTLPVKIQKHAACLSLHKANRSNFFTEIGSIECVDNLNTNTFLDSALLELKAIQARLFVSKKCTPMHAIHINNIEDVTSDNIEYQLAVCEKSFKDDVCVLLKEKIL